MVFMDWTTYNVLFKSLFEKTNTEDIAISEDNFNSYLARRYISFMSPQMAVYINDVSNSKKKMNIFEDSSKSYDFFKSVLPKIESPYIKYIKKSTTKKMEQTDFKWEDVESIASLRELSTKEVYEELLLLKELKML